MLKLSANRIGLIEWGMTENMSFMAGATQWAALRDAVDLFVGGRKAVCNADLEGAVSEIVFEGCREKIVSSGTENKRLFEFKKNIYL